MTKIKVNKSDLLSLVSDYNTKIQELNSSLQELSSCLRSIPDDSEITGVSAKASSIATSIEALKKDYLNEAKNLSQYTESITSIDEASPQEDSINLSSGTIATSSLKDVSFSSSSSALENTLQAVNGTTITLPAGLGTKCTYMGWQCITSPSSYQYKLRETAGMNFDSQGYGKINDRFVIATTTTFGKVGDYIDVKLTNGNVMKCIIGDIKSQGDPGCNQWGHYEGNNVVEFIVDKDSWYGKKENPSISDEYFVSERTGDVTSSGSVGVASITNKGNYFDYA